MKEKTNKLDGLKIYNICSSKGIWKASHKLGGKHYKTYLAVDLHQVRQKEDQPVSDQRAGKDGQLPLAIKLKPRRHVLHTRQRGEQLEHWHHQGAEKTRATAAGVHGCWAWSWWSLR